MSVSERRSPSFWAFILIAIGVVWLLREANVFTNTHLSVLLRFWPVILIGLGLSLLVGRSSSQLSTLIILGTIVLLLALMLIGPSVGLAQNLDIKTAQYEEPLGSTESAQINLNASIAHLVVNPLQNANNLFEADIEYVGDISFSGEGGDGGKVVTLANRGESVSWNPIGFLNWLGGDGDQIDWMIGVSPDVPVEMNVTLGVGGGELNLAGINLTGLHVNTGTGGVSLRLPNVDEPYQARLETGTGGGSIRVEEGAALLLLLSSGTSGMDVDVPDDAAVRLVASVGTGSINVPQRFNRVSGEEDRFIGDSGTWETEGFAAADRQIVIEYNGGTGGLTIR